MSHWPNWLQRKFPNPEKIERKKKQQQMRVNMKISLSTKWTNYMIKRFYCQRLFLHSTEKCEEKNEREKIQHKYCLYITINFIQTILTWRRERESVREKRPSHQN